MQGEAGRLPANTGDDRLGHRVWTEERSSEVLRLCRDVTGKLLDLGKLDDKPMQGLDIAKRGGSELNLGIHPTTLRVPPASIVSHEGCVDPPALGRPG